MRPVNPRHIARGPLTLIPVQTIQQSEVGRESVPRARLVEEDIRMGRSVNP